MAGLACHMTDMMDFVGWLVGNDSPLSIAANILALGTFALGFLGVRFANRTRQELREIRRRLPAGDPVADREALQNIQLLRRVNVGDNTRWHVEWSRLGADNTKTGQAVIESPRLLKELAKERNRIDLSMAAIVVGVVEYNDHGGGVSSSITVPMVHHIKDDHWMRAALFMIRRGFGRMVAEIR